MNNSVPTFPRFITAAAGVALLLATLSAQATQLQEDFAYPANALLDASLNGGIGFAGAWYTNGSSKTIVSNTDLSYSAGGYKISQVGGALSFGGIYTLYRGDTRAAATLLTNTVWFSALLNNPGPTAQAYLGVNAGFPFTNPVSSSSFSFGISNNTLVVGYGNANNSGSYIFTTFTPTTNNALTQGNTHLLLGCLAFPGGTLAYGTNIGSVMLWADPPDLTHLGAPQWQQSGGSSLIGQSLTNITVGGLNNGNVGAIRFSDGFGTNAQAYTDVTGTTNLNAFPATPTPSSFLAEDFANYVNGGNDTFSSVTANGGTGWNGPWAGGSSFSLCSTSSLAYSGSGYSIVQASGAGSFYGGYTGGYRGSTRFTATSAEPFPAQSNVWFSALMVASNAMSQAYLGFNSANGSLISPSTTYSVGLSNTCLVVGYGANGNYGFNTFTPTTNTTLTQGNTHLILGQILFQVGGNSTLQVWADPASLTNLGLPQWSQTAYNIGTNLQNVTIGGVSNGAVSAIRCSATATAYTDVTGTTNLTVPIPTVALTPVPAITGNGSNFVFTATTTGSNLAYQWAFNGAALTYGSSTLTVTNASSLSRGHYTITVTNLGGSASASGTLEVTNCNLNLVWQGGAASVGPAIWDVASTNWGLVSGPPTRQFYGDGDTVTFDDSASTNNVTIQNPVSPGGIILSNNLNAYNLSGATLSGPGALTVYGTGGLYLYCPCAYTGGTVTEPSSFNPTTSFIRVAPNVLTGNVTLNGGSLAFFGASGTFSGNVTGTNTLSQVAAAGGLNGYTATLSGNLAHAGPLYVNGGTVILTGTNTYGGTTTVGNLSYPTNNTVLVAGSAAALPSGLGKGNVVIQSLAPGLASLDLNGYNESINGLSGVANTVLGWITNSQPATTATLTVGNGGASAAYPCLLAGNLALVKTGAGTQTLSGVNTYIGSTTVSGGTLLVNSSLASGSAVTVASGGTLGGSGTIGGTVSVSSGGSLAAGNGTVGTTLTLSGSSVTLNTGGSLTFAASGGLLAGLTSKLAVTPALALNSVPITVTVTGNPLPNGTYRLLNCTGNLTGSAGALTVNGVGANGSASLSVTTGAGGHVDLVVSGGTAAGVATAPSSTSVCAGSAASFTVVGAGSTPLSYAWRKDGSGWGTGNAWSFTAGGGGFGLYDSTANGGSGSGVSGQSGGINSANNTSWGMYNTSAGSPTTATRSFPTALSAGQTFQMDMDNGYINNGNRVGFYLLNSTGNPVWEFFYVGSSSVNSYQIDDNSGVNYLSPNIPYTDGGLRIIFTLTSATTYSATIITLNTGPNTTNTYAGTLLSPAGGSVPAEVELYDANGAGGTAYNLCFNNLVVGPGADDNAGNYSTWGAGTLNLGEAPLANTGDITGQGTATLNFSAATTGDAGTYDCVVYNSEGYATATAATLTVGTVPSSETVSGSTTVCAGSPAAITMTPSQSGVTYQLYSNSIAAGNPTNGTGSAITWTVSPTSTTAYTVQSTAANGYCATAMSGTAVVTVDTPPTVETVSGATAICSGSPTTISMTGQNGVTYQLYSNSVASGSTQTGTGGTLTWTVSPAATTTYTVQTTMAGGYCAAAMNGNPVVTVSSGSPSTPGTITGSSSVCDGSSGVNYSIGTVSGATGYNWSVPTGASITGGSGTTSITVNWGTATSGSVTVNASNACGNSGNATLAVTVNSANSPVISISPGASDSAGTPVTFSVATSGGSPTGYAWRKLNPSAGWGTGNAWLMTFNSGGCDSYNGAFIGSATAAGQSPGINTSDQAFGLYANSWNSAEAKRGFGALSVGQNLSFDVQLPVTLTGNNGSGLNSEALFALRNSANEANPRLEMWALAGDSDVTLSDNAGNTLTTIPYDHNGYHCVFTLTGANTYSLTVTLADGSSGPYNYSGTLKGTSNDPVNQVRAWLRNYDSAGGAAEDFYFNNLLAGPYADNADHYTVGGCGSTTWANGANLGFGPVSSGSTYTLSSPATTDSGSYDVLVWDSCGQAFASSTNLTVSQISTFVGAFSSENPSGYRDSISFQAMLPSDATGSVVFSSTNGVFSTNSVSSGSAISLSITNLPRGTNVITVAYLGDAKYLGSSTNLNQIVTNHPPVGAVMAVTRTAGLRLLISLSNLATNWSDVDGDTVELTGVNMQSTNGVNLVALNWTTNADGSLATTNAAACIGYANSPNVNDQINYAIADGQGGTNIGYINILIQSSVTGTNSITGITTGGTNVISAYGIPGYTYILERATNLAPAVWANIATNTAATNGVINAADSFWDLGGFPPASAFYQLLWQP